MESVQTVLHPAMARAFASKVAVAAVKTYGPAGDNDVQTLTFRLTESRTPPNPGFVFLPIQALFAEVALAAAPTELVHR